MIINTTYSGTTSYIALTEGYTLFLKRNLGLAFALSYWNLEQLRLVTFFAVCCLIYSITCKRNSSRNNLKTSLFLWNFVLWTWQRIHLKSRNLLTSCTYGLCNPWRLSLTSVDWFGRGAVKIRAEHFPSFLCKLCEKCKSWKKNELCYPTTSGVDGSCSWGSDFLI